MTNKKEVTILFKKNGQYFANPDIEKDIDIQRKLRKKITDLIEPVKHELLKCNGASIEVDYNYTDVDRPAIRFNGFDVNGHAKLNILFKDFYPQ